MSTGRDGDGDVKSEETTELGIGNVGTETVSEVLKING